MTEFSQNSVDYLEIMLDRFHEKDLRYVVLRDYQDLPHSINGSDVDFFVHPEDFNQAMSICENVFPGDPTRKDSIPTKLRNNVKLSYNAAKNPLRAVKFAFTKKNELKQMLVKREKHKNINQSDDKVKHAKYQNNDLWVHFMNHLAYKSTKNGNYRRVNPAIETVMIRDRVKNEYLYHPSPEDELAHLVCRLIFHYPDSSDVFERRYGSRIEGLVSDVKQDEARQEKFELLLENIFFDAHKLIKQEVFNGNLDSMFRKLQSYSKY